jgi:hypothetical protein
MPSNTCESNVGRLLEIRVAAGYQCPEDVDRMIALLRQRIGQLPTGIKFVVSADWRKVGMMSPVTAARVHDMLTFTNPRVQRSAILTLPDTSLANLQTLRLVREAQSANRRHFTQREDQHRWLSEVLTEEESRRLAEFLELT